MSIQVECRQIEQWHGPKTTKRTKAPFGGTVAHATKLLTREVKLLEGTRIIVEVSGDVKIRQDGWPYATTVPTPAIAASFNTRHGWLRYQTDKYNTWHGNLHAIALTLERLRAVDRYGTTNRAEQYTGFAALAAGSSTTTPDPIAFVADLLGVAEGYLKSSPRDHIRTARQLTHPDRGGDHEHFLIVQQAAELLGEAGA